MDIGGKNALVLGGYGLVGSAVCRELLDLNPARLVVASFRKDEALAAVDELKKEYPKSKTKLLPAWGDIFLRAEWLEDSGMSRGKALNDPQRRKRLVGDVLDQMDAEILEASLLAQLIMGKAEALDGSPMDIVIDCINTSTALAYQNIYSRAHEIEDKLETDTSSGILVKDIEVLLSSLYVPQLVRHIQILHEAMIQANTSAYIKVGTAGTGGMGLNIPYTHGEEKPSRVLMSKAALAGAQSLLTFLMARTTSGPHIVKEIKPTALIAWKEIGFGPIRRGGQDILLYDCEPGQAVSINEKANLSPNGEFGQEAGGTLEAVYINTGENGLFAAGDFAAITSIGQMEFVTPEEIAHNVVMELRGGNTGKDIVGALDGAVMGPTFRAGHLRQAALNKLRDLGEQHGESVAFELLGPPRMSKLLFESFLLKQTYSGLRAALEDSPGQMSDKLHEHIKSNPRARQEIISIGLPILLPDGENLLRGPMLKSENAHSGWVDLTTQNMERWQTRLKGILAMIDEQLEGETSSRFNRDYPTLREWVSEDRFEIGEMVAWVSINEDDGRRGKE
jgi:NAD(P)-dependent dehydrogenase (short-subunit alcohol dehydrogenase family)